MTQQTNQCGRSNVAVCCELQPDESRQISCYLSVLLFDRRFSCCDNRYNSRHYRVCVDRTLLVPIRLVLRREKIGEFVKFVLKYCTLVRLPIRKEQRHEKETGPLFSWKGTESTEDIRNNKKSVVQKTAQI